MVGDNGSPGKVSVDGTDFRTVDWKLFDPSRWSHKFNAVGPLRYEILWPWQQELVGLFHLGVPTTYVAVDQT